jgi:oligopeptide transport system substrate-binding protein
VERFGGGSRPGTAWTRPGNLVGNGPFVLRSWRPDQEIVVASNPNYWDRGRVKLREIHFLPMSDAAVEERAFRSGELDVTWALPGERMAAYRGQPGSPLHVAPQLHTSYIVFNTARRPFDDVRVRRAFSLCIDRDRVIPAITHGTADPAHSLTRPGTADFQPPPRIDFDPVEARRLLAAAGHAGGVGLPPIALSIAGKYDHLAEALQEAWHRELGVRVEIQPQEEKVLFDSLDSGTFQCAQMGFFYAVNAPETILMVLLSDSRWNSTRWKSPAYDAAFRAAGNADNDKARFAACATMERILHDEAPLSPLMFPNQVNLISPLVHGWRDNPLWAIDWRELSLGH